MDDHEHQSSRPPLKINVKPATVHFEPPDAYKNVSKPRGNVFIGNFKNFDQKTKLPSRPASTSDVNYLRDLFDQMNYHVDEGIEDGTRENTLNTLEKFSKSDIHSEADSCVVIFMSHGREEKFYTSDGEIINYKEVCGKFSDKNCPHLKGKPKLFLFHTCEVNGESDVPDSAGNSYRRGQNHKMADVYVCFSAGQRVTCCKHTKHGAAFIQQVCEVFMDHVKDKQFDSLMKLVARGLPEEEESEVKEIGIKENFYFNPPKKSESNDKCSSSTVKDQDDSLMCGVADSVQISACEMETEDTYKMTSTPQGLVLIINNLSGCEQDVNKLGDIFQQLGYKVLIPLSDMTYDKLMKELENFKQENHHDSAIIIFYGHGFEDCIVSSDNVAIKFKELTKSFNDRNCPKLAGRPKILIFNTCFTDTFSYPPQNQSTANEIAHSSDRNEHDSESGVQDVVTAPEAADKDMIILSVEVDGGQCENGSLLTEALYQVLLASTSITKELSPLLRLISKKLNELCGEDNTEQYFVEISSIRFQKELFFSLSKFDTDTVDGPLKSLERAGNYRSEKINIIEAKQISSNITYPRGQAIIIGYTTYEANIFPNCDWRMDDMKLYKELTEKLGYKTNVHQNLTLEEVKSTLQTYNDMKEHNKSDSTIVIVLGHACDVNNFYGKNGKLVPVAEIYRNFTDEKCPSLKTKPKLFFFHMTELKQWGCTSITPPDEKLREAFSLYLISTVQNNKHPVEGLHALRKAIESCAYNTHFENIINRAEVALLSTDSGKSERFIKKRIKFTNDFYFNPKRRKE